MQPITTVPVKYYTAREATVNVEFLELTGQDWTDISLQQFGTTQAVLRGEDRFQSQEIGKRCMANLVPWLAKMVFVHFPTVDLDGKPLERTARQSAFLFAAETYGVPIWSQSGGKAGTFGFISKSAFRKLTVGWDKATAAESFAAYSGLLLSQLAGKNKQPVRTLTVEPHYRKATDGKDGNCLGESIYFGKYSVQHRVLGLRTTPGGELRVSALGKGQIRPKRNLGTKVDLNDTQIKFDSGTSDQFIIGLNEGVNGRPGRQYVSFELVQLLQRHPYVERVLQERVEREVFSIIECLTPNKRLELLERLGGLLAEDGQLLEAQRNVISALRSNIPWCIEIESRVGRFALREIAEKIIPSAGLWGWTYRIYQDDSYGEGPCEWADAECFGFRMPLPGPEAVVPFKHNPKGVVTSEVAERMNGDSDMDSMVVVVDKQIVGLFRDHMLPFTAGKKPSKERNGSALTPERMVELGLQTMDDAWLMGALTIAEAKLIQLGLLEEAGMAGFLANVSPMLLKWDIKLGGVDVHEVMSDFLREYRPLLKATTLQWREKMLASKAVRSPRDLARAEFYIDEPQSLLDDNWNWGWAVVNDWAARTKPEHIGLIKTAKVIYSSLGKRVLSGAASRWMRVTVDHWGQYWATWFENHPDEKGKPFNSRAHRGIIEWAVSEGENADVEGLAALALWRPQNVETTGFFLKWLAIGKRFEEVFGLHPEVAEYLQEQGKLENLADALLRAVMVIDEDEDLMVPGEGSDMSVEDLYPPLQWTPDGSTNPVYERWIGNE